jgi:putative phosphoribosyl transferase
LTCVKPRRPKRRKIAEACTLASIRTEGDMSTGTTAAPKTYPVALCRAQLHGEVVVPAGATGLVIFAHGSGSSRLSPRNIHAAHLLHAQGLATLLFDLLTEEEGHHRHNIFDIGLLAARLAEAIRFARSHAELTWFPLGLFGASTGAAAALVAAAQAPHDIAAVVARGGRPDLAGDALQDVRAPTLLIVGGADRGVVELNVDALDQLTCEKRLEIVPGATHLFEEPGALDAVATLAGRWFQSHFRAVRT